jgi:hypothetical protein
VTKNIEKDFNFLKYYIFIINWAAVKFNIRQTDLELGFHFYENVHFTKEEFINKCRLFTHSNERYFKRFLDSHYIYELKTIRGGYTQPQSLGIYRLSARFINVLTAIYDKLTFEEPHDFKPSLERKIPPELEAVLIEMAQENTDIINGKKQPSLISLIKKIEL